MFLRICIVDMDCRTNTNTNDDFNGIKRKRLLDFYR